MYEINTRILHFARVFFSQTLLKWAKIPLNNRRVTINDVLVRRSNYLQLLFYGVLSLQWAPLINLAWKPSLSKNLSSLTAKQVLIIFTILHIRGELDVELIRLD